MIEPMLKYEILLYHQEFEPFLKALQAKGLLDLSLGDLAVKGTQEEDYRYGVRAERLERALKDWRRLHADAVGAVTDFPEDEITRIAWTEDAMEQARRSAEQEATLRQAAEKEAVWGAYDPAFLAGLAQAGLTLRFGSMPAKTWPAEAERVYPAAAVAQTGGRVYFVYWEELPVEWRVQEEAAPTQSPAEWAVRLEEARRRKAADEARVAYAADRVADFGAARRHCWNRLAYRVARTDMRSEAEGSLRIVEG
ncbi:MAG: hypothetical protein K2O01_09435, partial [Bacteroidales bacterium]|nr:hypothetical protein [Bacteroidales bacterium]